MSHKFTGTRMSQEFIGYRVVAGNNRDDFALKSAAALCVQILMTKNLRPSWYLVTSTNGLEHLEPQPVPPVADRPGPQPRKRSRKAS